MSKQPLYDALDEISEIIDAATEALLTQYSSIECWVKIDVREDRFVGLAKPGGRKWQVCYKSESEEARPISEMPLKKRLELLNRVDVFQKVETRLAAELKTVQADAQTALSKLRHETRHLIEEEPQQ